MAFSIIPGEKRSPKVLNKEGLDLIKSCEGLRLKAYKDVVGVQTIGFGHTGADVYAGQLISNQEAERLLLKDTASFQAGVNASVTWVGLTDNQFAACVSLAYNVGLANFRSSTLLKKLNAGQVAEAAEEFDKWNKAGGKVIEGLTNRRLKERALFLKI